MIISRCIAPPGRTLSRNEIHESLHQALDRQFAHQKILVLIPDHTRTLPLPFLFRALVEILQDARCLDFMVALGTHPPLSEGSLNDLVGITAEERTSTFKDIRLLNHAWDDPSALVSLGSMNADEIKSISGESWHPSLPVQIDIRINKLALEYDHILILGPTFPHEVAGFSGGAKYLFPGISGPEMINATHWLGALAGVVGTIGLKETPVRAMIHAAAGWLDTPVTLIALVVAASEEGGIDHDLAGLFIGDLFGAWSLAADLSARCNVIWSRKHWQRVLSCAPPMYDELWTAAKAMYKLEPAVAVGGEVIIYAPHLEVVSRVHGKFIAAIGYHILPFFLDHWERFKQIPLGVLAHSTHLRGSGVMEHGMEKPNVNVVLSSRIPAEECKRLNLSYLDPGKVDLNEWKGREPEGVLCVPRAGEMLYRVKKGEER